MSEGRETRAPDSLLCVGCGYDVGPGELTVCPECGREVTEEMRRYAAARVPLLARRSAWRRLAVISQAAGVVVCTLGVVLVAKQRTEPAWAAGFCLGVCALGWVAGWGVSALAGSDRALVAAMWERRAVLLQAPWLAVPVFTVVFGLVLAGLELVGVPYGLVAVWGMLFMVGWAVLSVIGMARWRMGWHTDAERVGLAGTRAARAGAIAGGALGLASGLLGLLGVMAGQMAAAALVYERFH